MLEPKPTSVRRLDGSTELLDIYQVTMSDRLHLLVVEVTKHNTERIEAHRLNRDLTRKETETSSGAAAEFE